MPSDATLQPVDRRRGPSAAVAAAPFVSVVIVNYNGKHYLADCLRAVEAQTYPADRREVLLIDNGSTDGSAEWVRAHHPGVRLIALRTNRGFAGGNNVGFRAAAGEWIALVNNDTVAEPGWLAALVEAAGADPRVGGVTSKILLQGDAGTINSTGLTLYRDGRGGDRGFRQPDDGRYDQPGEVFGGCGASVLLRRAMLDDVGPFDERFFLYYEDLDLAWRARLRGWTFVYTPRSVVRHVHCGTAGEWSPLFLYYVERNRVFANVKNAPPRLALRCLAVFAARAGLKWLRVLTFQARTPRDRGQAVAYVRAGLSLLVRLPGMLCSRVRIRWLRRRVPDAAITVLMAPRPS